MTSWTISLFGVCLVDCGYTFTRQPTVAPEKKSYIPDVKVDSGPRGRLFLSVWRGFFAAEMQHFSASVHPDVEAQVAGTPGV